MEFSGDTGVRENRMRRKLLRALTFPTTLATAGDIEPITVDSVMNNGIYVRPVFST